MPILIYYINFMLIMPTAVINHYTVTVAVVYLIFLKITFKLFMNAKKDSYF